MTMKYRDQLVQLAQELLADGLVVRTWGNFSIRIPDDGFIITPTGRDYRTLDVDDLVHIHSDGSISGKLKPSSEYAMHAMAYKQRPDVNAVIHTHQPFGSALSVSGVDRVLDEPGKLALNTSVIPVAAYGIPGTKRLHKAVDAALERSHSNLVLMCKHGVLALGKDPESARELANVLEEQAERLYQERVAAPSAMTWHKVVRSIRKDGKIQYFDSDGELAIPDSVVRVRHERMYRERPEIRAIEVSRDLDTSVFYGSVLPPYLDDFAQIVGVCADSTSSHNAVLLDDQALCLGKDEAAAVNAKLVLHKNVRAARMAKVVGAAPIPRWEAWLMHQVYTNRYSKRATK